MASMTSTNNQGWVSVGIDHDTAQFAAESHSPLVEEDGVGSAIPMPTELLITADGGGSNGSRCRLVEGRAAGSGRPTGTEGPSHCHFPPGTSKWNKIEHRMFCHITQNWRGRPLVSHEVIVQLIANTATSKGLKIQAELDTRTYPVGSKVSDEEFAA